MNFKPVSTGKLDYVNIAFGGAAISGEGGGYGFGEISDSAAQKLLMVSFDRGITVFDTAPIYGFGLSEKRMGEAFRNIRDRVFIVSKCGVTWHSTKRVNMTNDPSVAEQMLSQSLKDLKSDYIDLYMVHWPDAKVDIRYTYEVLLKAKEVGKVRYIGLCNSNIEEFNKASEIGNVDCLQSEYNLFNQTHFEDLPTHIPKMGWGTFDKGILTGRVDKERKFDQSDCRSWAPWWKKSPLDAKLAKVEKIKLIIREYDLSLLDIALHFSLKNQINLMPIVGIKNDQQLNSVLDSYHRNMNEAVIAQLLGEISDS